MTNFTPSDAISQLRMSTAYEMTVPPQSREQITLDEIVEFFQTQSEGEPWGAFKDWDAYTINCLLVDAGLQEPYFSTAWSIWRGTKVGVPLSYSLTKKGSLFGCERWVMLRVTPKLGWGDYDSLIEWDRTVLSFLHTHLRENFHSFVEAERIRREAVKIDPDNPLF